MRTTASRDDETCCEDHLVIPVSLIVTTKNESVNIEKCLRSATGLFDQIFVMTNGGPPGPGGATTTVSY